MKFNPRFFVLEGVDKVGKSTQIERLKKHLSSETYHFTREPTDSALGLFIREQMKTRNQLTPSTWAYLFAADRHEHVYGRNGIINQLQNKKIVVCDRYFFSTLAYQGLDLNLFFEAVWKQENLDQAVLMPAFMERAKVSELNKDFPLPQTVFYLELDDNIWEKRLASQAFGKVDVFEQDLQRLKQVRVLYQNIWDFYEKKGLCVVKIDAAQTEEEITRQILSYVVVQT